jgi:hypothetical protein
MLDRHRIAGAGVDSNQLAFVMVEIEKIETDAAVARRRDLQKPTPMPQRLQRWFEHQSTDRVENHIGPVTVCQFADTNL